MSTISRLYNLNPGDKAYSGQVDAELDQLVSAHNSNSDAIIALPTKAETLTGKTLMSPKINENVALTSTATELNKLHGVTTTTNQLNFINDVVGPVQLQLTQKVSLIESESIGGVKTFPLSPIVPTPTTGTQVANKAYVDSADSLRYTKSEMQASGGALLHWNNLTNKPNMADASWKTSVANKEALPLTGNTLTDQRIVLDDGDGKQSAYTCIAITGAVYQQWAKIGDIDWASEEATRVTQENARVSAEGSGSTGRVGAESARVASENTRTGNENTRTGNENTRISNESTRVTSEGIRNTAEGNRSNAEILRNSQEITRLGAEYIRVSAEQSRAGAEDTRESGEAIRVENENIRDISQMNRSYFGAYSPTTSYNYENCVYYNGSSYRCEVAPSLGHLPTDTNYWVPVAIKGDRGDGGASTAAAVSIADAGYYYTGATVELALQEVGTSLAGKVTTPTTANTKFGKNALISLVNGNLDTAIGSSALHENTSGNSNTAVGESALFYNINGSYNVAVGEDALAYNTSGGENTAAGVGSLGKITTGHLNTGVGYGAGNHTSQKVDASNSMALGANTYTTANNQVVIGDANVTDIRFAQGAAAISPAELNCLAGVTSAIQTQLNAKVGSDSPTLTGTVVLPSTTSIGNVSSDELGYLDGVTSSIQAQLNAAGGGGVTATTLSDALAFADIIRYDKAHCYFVAKTGNDTSGNGSFSAPWLTINKALEAASPVTGGDTVYVREGTYNERVKFYKSGSTNSFITLRPFPSEKVVVDGTGIASSYHYQPYIDIHSQSWVRVFDMAVVNCDGMGIGDVDDTTNNSHIVIRGCSTNNTAMSGIHFWYSDNVLIDGCKIENSNYLNEQEALSIVHSSNVTVSFCDVGGMRREGIDFKDGCTHGLIFHNFVHDSYEYGYNDTYDVPNNAGVGIYCDATAATNQYIEISNNTVKNCVQGLIISAETGGTSDTINVHDNHFVDCGYASMWLSQYTGHHASNITFRHNTCIGMDKGLFIDITDAYASNITIDDNIFTGNENSVSMYIPGGLGTKVISCNNNSISVDWGGTDYPKGTNPLVLGADRPLHNTYGQTQEFNDLADDDMIRFFDTSAKYEKKSGWANVKALIKTYYDSLTTTLTNKRINPRITTIVSSATPIPDLTAADVYVITALAGTATFGAPTGTPTEGQQLIIRIKDNGTAQTLAWNAIYRGVGTALPTTTVLGKMMIIWLVYNAVDTRWDLAQVCIEGISGATLTGAETLTNKTLTTPKITSILTPTNTLTLPTSADTVVARATTDTLTNKRITKRVNTVASGTPIAINGDTTDLYTVTALAVAATISAPTGTPTNGQELVIRFKDNATARALTWNAIFRSMGATLPTTTVLSKTMYCTFMYNSTDSTWDLLQLNTQA